MIVTHLLNQYTIDNEALNNINFALFRELRNELLTVCTKHLYSENLDKKVSKTIPDSQAILFFHNFNGLQINGYESVVLKEFCKQIQKELFISGKYNLMLNFKH